MNSRKFGAHTQRSHISSCKRFAAFLRRSPETATSQQETSCRPIEASTRPSSAIIAVASHSIGGSVASIHEKNYVWQEKRCFARKRENAETACTDGLGGRTEVPPGNVPV